MTLTLPPGSRIIEGFEAPADLDAPYPTPYGDNPPLEWFTTPHHDVIPGATGLITADGRFCAYSHEWDRCHNGYTSSGECWTPPPSVTGNRYFMQSSAVTAEGVQVPVGVIPLGGGHAPLDVDIYQAMAHYDRPERVVVRARVVETETGAVMCGALVPGVTHRQVGIMRAAAMSGDWRWVPELGALEFLGPCFVARPGLPLGLEQAALDAALWDLTRQVETVSAGGRVVGAVTRPTLWSPRPILTTNVPSAVLAAAQTGETAMTFTAAPHVHAAAGACSCQTPFAAPVAASSAPAPAALPAPRVRAARAAVRVAAAGTPYSYEELNEAVRSAVKATFMVGEGTWVYVRDWDDSWAVFELESDNPIDGYTSKDYMVGIAIGPDGTVSVARDSVTEVVTQFVPAPGTGPASPGPAPAPPVAAAGEDGLAMSVAGLQTQLQSLVGTVQALASDVARLAALQLEPANLGESLPAPPEVS